MDVEEIFTGEVIVVPVIMSRLIIDKGRATNKSILQFCLAFSHQCVYLSSVKRSEAIKCGVIQW